MQSYDGGSDGEHRVWLALLDGAQRLGVLEVVTAERPLREGKLIRYLPAPSALPLGMGDLTDALPEVTEEVLQPGHHLLLYTDGVVEARSEAGEFFGVDRLAGFMTRALADQLPAAETMRRLVRAILDHQHEQLQDDATAVCLHWLAHGSSRGG
jgi:Lon protease-like protein